MVALFELGVREAAHAIRAGEQTAEALAEALLARCAAASPLNAFISLEADRLRAAARAADQRRQRGERLGPLHGVPLALKDNIDTADFPTTGGTPALAAHRPKRNAPIVQHLLDAGAIVLGKTNLQELAFGPTNNNAAFGPARKGPRLGLPRGYFWENLDAELAAILEAALARLREAGVVLVEGDVANVAALDAAAGFPILLHETVIELWPSMKPASTLRASW